MKNDNKVKKVPNLRFPGFDSEWEEKKLGEMFEFKSTNSYSREDLNYKNGEVKNIHYGDIHTKYRTLFDITKEVVPFVNSELRLPNRLKENYCKKGDLIFADASEDLSDVGKSIEIVNLDAEGLVSGLHTILARPLTDVFHLGFKGYLFKSASVRFQIQRQAQGTKVLSISASRLSKIDLVIPCKREQEKITALLSSIDAQIDTQSKIIEVLETQMHVLQERVFKQKTKFNNEKRNAFSAWNIVLSGDIFANISNKSHHSDLPVLAITQEHGAIPRELINYQISVTQKSVENYKVVQSGDFIISLRSFQGGIEYSSYNGICSPAYIVLRSNVQIDPRFYKFYFKTSSYIKKLNKKLEGIRDGKMISYSHFAEIKIPFPYLEEQTKVADFLSCFEAKVNLEKSFLQKMKEQKSFLLQNLFV